jgi:SSS family solute:Na+ symporter
MRDSVTGQELTFWSIAISIVCYVVVSFATSRQPFNMDRLLHRGKYALDGETHKNTQATSWLERLGFDSEMTRRDRWVTAITLAWPAVFTIVFFAALIAHASGWEPGAAFWATAWKWYTAVALTIAAIVVTWFTIGGIIDMRAMFKRLAVFHANAQDDGRIVDHHNADE